MSFLALDAYAGIAGGLLLPVADLLEGLGEGVDDDIGLAVAETLDGEVRSLLRIVRDVPESDDDAVVGKVRADAMADGAGL